MSHRCGHGLQIRAIVHEKNLAISEPSGFLEGEINNGSFALTKKGKNLVIKDENETPYPYDCMITDDQVVLENESLKITLTKK